jgi:L-lactate dehydrogenase complex protein LldG
MNGRDPTGGSGDAPRHAVLGISQEVMLARIRGSLGAGRSGSPTPPEIDERVARLVAQEDDVASVFVANATAGGMRVERLRLCDLESAIARGLRETKARAVSVACDEARFAEIVEGACENEGISIVRSQRGLGFEPHYESQVGVTDVCCAVAETGSLVISSTARRGRAPVFVPPIHFAIVPASRIVGDLLDVWSVLRRDRVVEQSASVVFVSGPSKTGDIEGVLVTGVHGPGEVLVLLVDDL